ncbi:sigma 54-interacting transcriptional regulator [Candidatus Berkiella aquae]|uniref:Sigma-54 dependent transcriptional regulator n=1 Tax=Candidatus Berkiella aquae TaxID=295108 RepID=A0A0Q9YND1_9GAMM|nr:sigma-54 dependent transcriptional regulator [Candidatus Berkiella aquae]MCS5712490.1 sigma-54 dependent transcriptional regulator [Candidatus Berkiella aquae]
MEPLALIIDDEPDICQLLEITLRRMSINALSVQSIKEAKKLLATRTFDICLTDMRLGDGNGLDLVSFVQTHYPQMPIAVITAHGNMETAVKALKLGAFDCISKPVDLNQLRDIVSGALKLNANTHNDLQEQLIGQSAILQTLRQQIAKLARSQAPVYISGPSGCGKELVARIIHQSGSRQEGPFIPVNCGAIPQELMESEFFGFLKGSFTGAHFDKMGFFKAAHKGTLFLDEVADLPIAMQVKLLRAIQEKAIRPLGSNQEMAVDVRILCATHKNLHHLVQQNLFRQDLFYRLNVIELRVPSLQERKEDIPLLTTHILTKIAANSTQTPPTLDNEAIEILCDYNYPGNVRELENILERALTLSDGKHITLHDLHLPHQAQTIEQQTELGLDDYLISMERQVILDALEKAHGNKTAAAKLLGISFRTLRYRLKKIGLDSDAK